MYKFVLIVTAASAYIAWQALTTAAPLVAGY